MTTKEIICLGVGVLIGIGIVFYQIDTPPMESCGTYKVAHKVKIAYVLKPPPAEVIYKACPQVTEKVENVSEPEITKAEETPRRRHRRHHRVRRYWR